jgi:hypothetical protein
MAAKLGWPILDASGKLVAGGAAARGRGAAPQRVVAASPAGASPARRRAALASASPVRSPSPAGGKGRSQRGSAALGASPAASPAAPTSTVRCALSALCVPRMPWRAAVRARDADARLCAALVSCPGERTRAVQHASEMCLCVRDAVDAPPRLPRGLVTCMRPCVPAVSSVGKQVHVLEHTSADERANNKPHAPRSRQCHPPT